MSDIRLIRVFSGDGVGEVVAIGSKGRLELTWVGKHDERLQVEPRILVEDSAHSYRRPSPTSQFDNRLIHGDNLLALRAIEDEFGGQVKCIAIDPPYNTGSAFEHYDDGIEHSIWLSLMRDRLEIMRRLLTEDGSLWITVDDNEAHYLKVLCDEVFGRNNFVANVVWQKRTSPDARLRLGDAHDHILVFAKSARALAFNRLAALETKSGTYRNPNNDPRGPWTSTDFTAQGWRPNQMYTITSPRGVRFEPPPGRCWSNLESVFAGLIAENRIWFGKDGSSRPRVKSFLSESEGISAWSWWDNSAVGHNQEAKKESIALFGPNTAFTTPKPERLMKRIIELATNPGDLVLDSFAGSGTTGAVAHKMGRRWIMVEIGEHAHTHIIPRLKRVIDGDDKGGVTDATGWAGGGGFRYFTLGPSLVTKDRHGRPILNRALNETQLRAAIAKLEGYVFAPSETVYWQHGQSTETDFIYVVPRTLSHQELAALSEDVGSERTLKVVCKAWRGKADAWPNLSMRRIPRQLDPRCEWGRDDYSLVLDRIIIASPQELLDAGGIASPEEGLQAAQ